MTNSEHMSDADKKDLHNSKLAVSMYIHIMLCIYEMYTIYVHSIVDGCTYMLDTDKKDLHVYMPSQSRS